MTNLEAKKEAIKNAYGEYYDTLKKYLNGFMVDRVNYERETGNKLSDLEGINFIDEPLVYSYPDVVEGFQNNNGWIRIESEADLPKLKSAEELNCFIKASDDERIGMGIYAFGRFMTFFGNEYANVTHYQPILKPKPPIY